MSSIRWSRATGSGSRLAIGFAGEKAAAQQPPRCARMIRSIAQLGGFLARKSDGEPGTQTLWRGLQRMDDITAAFAASARLRHAAMNRPTARTPPR